MKWSRNGEIGTIYRRKFPDSSYDTIVTKKAKFFGQLMYCVLVAGGSPQWFRPYNLRSKSMENLLDSLLSNNVNFHITYDGFRKSKKMEFYTVYYALKRKEESLPEYLHLLVKATSKRHAFSLFMKFYNKLSNSVKVMEPSIDNVIVTKQLKLKRLNDLEK